MTATAHEQRTADHYRHETAGHQLTVLRDDGLYRHLRYAAPDTALYRYDILTWPGGLAVRGDGPNVVFGFHGTPDPFTLFRRSSHHGAINPGYWRQYVKAGSIKDWSSDNFRRWITGWAAAREDRHPGLGAAVRTQILDNDDYDLDYEECARAAVAHFHHDGRTLDYPFKWQHDFDDWSWEYLKACHAVVDVITAYDHHVAALTTAQAHP